MTIVRCYHNVENPYVMVLKESAQDKQLSFAARGFLTYALSKPTDWRFHLKQIMQEQGIGRNALYTIINELIDKGYCLKNQKRSEKTGAFGSMEYVILEKKSSADEITNLRERLKISLPQVDFPDAANQGPVNQPLLNNEANKIYIKTTTHSPPIEGMDGCSFSYQKETQDQLTNLGISNEQLKLLANQFEEEKILHALEYCKTVPAKKDVISQITWAAKMLPELPKKHKQPNIEDKIKNVVLISELPTNDSILVTLYEKEVTIYSNSFSVLSQQRYDVSLEIPHEFFKEKVFSIMEKMDTMIRNEKERVDRIREGHKKRKESTYIEQS